MKYLGFDIEVCTWPEDNEWDHKTPLGVSCIGLMGSSWLRPIIYYAGMPNDPEPRKMNTEELRAFCIKLGELHYIEEYEIVTWNGLQFDFLVMALEDPNNAQTYAKMAMRHIDPMFFILCSKGWPVGLQTVAKGLRLPGKTEGISGADAPDLWLRGSDEDRKKVLEYVGQDAKTTVDIVEVANRTTGLYWFSKSGRPQKLQIGRIPTVKECLEIPVPDTSWMDRPLKREDFYAWTEGYLS